MLNLLVSLFIIMSLVGFGLAYFVHADRPWVRPAVLAVSILFICIAIQLPSASLITKGKTAPATVQKVECEQGKKHHVYYSYVVDGHRFEDMSLDSNGDGVPSCQFLKPGDIAFVTYLPEHPSVNSWGRPEGNFYFTSFLCLLFNIIIPVTAFNAQRKRLEELHL